MGMDSDDDDSEEVMAATGHVKSKSHLMRRHSSVQWDQDEIEKLKDEMAGQLEFLQRSHTKSLSLTRSRSCSKEVPMQVTSSHNLMRIKSAEKWDSDEIDEEEDDMRQELVRLTSPKRAHSAM